MQYLISRWRTMIKDPDYRYHFTPGKGWMNDPNGAILIGDTYHLFYQYYPDDIVWGPMHWGHAVSRDLISWERKEIAIFPDELGYIFSGSCVLDEENVSGFGAEGQKPLIAIYTSHNPETGEQQQGIAYSLDYEHFTVFEGNPVISNVRESDGYKVDFRDPKVFKNPALGGFSMVLSGGRTLVFYHTYNFKEWTYTGSFDPSIAGFGGICECPDCIFMKTEAGEKWVLTLSSILDDEYVGKPLSEHGYVISRVMQYFVGEFDGKTFINSEPSDEPLILDHGPDNYAMVTFYGTGEPIAIGWGENWEYAQNTPADKFRGKMTIPRKFSLVKTVKGYRLCQKSINEQLCDEYVLYDGNEISYDNGKLKLKFEAGKLTLDRSLSVDKSIHKCFEDNNYKSFSVYSADTAKCTIRVIKDEGFYEIFADEGLISMCIMTYNTR